MRASKLPDVGTTIFTIVSRRARELGALNLGQGFPDYDIDPRLAALVAEAMRTGHNQYAPMEGTPELRARIALKVRACYGVESDPDAEITVTQGATEAIYSAIQAAIGPGDEAIAFDPAYDSYEPAVRLAGGRCVRVPLAPPDFRYDWDRVRAALSERTRLVLLNSPANPACTVATAGDLASLAAAIRGRDVLVLSDEVYEHVVFDGARHHSVLAHAELRDKSFAVFSFGKTLHATGLRVGYCIAPRALTAELRKVHQFNTFSIATPLQQAIALYLAEQPDGWRGLAGFFQAKRDRLRTALAGSGFRLPPAQGTYFQLLDFGEFAPPDDLKFAERLLTEAGVASIPLSPFYAAPPPLKYLRLCIAKRDDTLDAAAARLTAFAARLAGGGR
ncbi:MAG: aminotransferase class I/II-fold pyridoxal phosphate-dependent enzyme [Gammaproteobacteria bacterium]|nr:aminotransferase class I/II-fold pyridoxal phosphate-dependent enzyme [Gammaproteobacteria bacterium]